MANKFSSVIIRRNNERGPSEQAYLSWECIIDGQLTLHVSKANAERFAQTKTGFNQGEILNANPNR